MNDKVFRFGECEIRIAPREVVCQGQAQQVEPKAFDLLVYLIEHRDRVVSKDELLDKLWPNSFAPPGVIARAVMKARQAIGEQARTSASIRTVHRTGYRFVGELQWHEARSSTVEAKREEAPRPTQVSAPPLASDTVSLALLPFENHTGRPELDWVELGLMSLVAKALRADRRLSIAPIDSLLAALDNLPTGAGLSERVQVVNRLLGARHVVQVRVSIADGQFNVDYGVANTADGKRERLRGAELTRLGQRLARQLEAMFIPASSVVPVPFDSADPLANRALARAMQAMGECKWKVALNLLRVVLDIEPDNQAVLLEQLRALAALDSCAAFSLGAQLLARARAASDTRLAAAVHLALGNAYMERRLVDQAKHHLDESLRLAVGLDERERVVATTFLRASIGISLFDFDKARELLDRAELLCDASGNQFDRIRLIMLRMLLHVEAGRLQQASLLAQQAVALSRAHGMHEGMVSSMGNLARVNARLGRLREAVKLGTELLAMDGAANRHTVTAVGTMAMCQWYRMLRRPKDIARTLAVFDRIDLGAAPISRAYRLMGQGHLEVCLQQHGAAAQSLREASVLLQQAGQALDHRRTFGWLACALIQSGQTAATTALFAEIRSLPAFAHDREMQGTLMYCQAQQAHTDGERVRARDGLCKAFEVTPAGYWRAFACIDGAWLHLEAGNVDRAGTLLRDIESWLADYPIAMAVHARRLYAENRYAEANEAHRTYLKSIATEVPAYHLELGALYAMAARRPPAKAAPLPLTPKLPTEM